MRHSKKPRRGRARDASADALFERALLGETQPSDKPFDPARDRKTLQLCRQVQRSLSMALPGEGADELLGDLYVDSVEPMGSAGQLLVRVTPPAGARPDLHRVLERLNAHAPRLRAAVARDICRKRVPTLSFVVLPPPDAATARSAAPYPPGLAPSRKEEAQGGPNE